MSGDVDTCLAGPAPVAAEVAAEVAGELCRRVLAALLGLKVS